jgi:regulation of enolase protein 1 (concanavalin A-like superfamily)
MISDLAHEYGDVVTIQGDPRVYGRLYVGTNGRGILYADIHTPQTNLPGGWSTQDIGSVGSAGAAGSPAAGTWELTGGGAGIAGTADTFRFAYTTLSGDGTITAKVMGVPNASPANNNALAGVMIRNDLTAGSAQALMAMTPGSVNGAVFDYRSTTGGSIGSANATTGVWNPYWVRLTRSGSTFTAYRSADGTTWTQVGAAQTIAMNSTVYVGLATTASDNNQVNTSNFQNVSVAGVSDPPPTVGTPASASPSTVVGTTTSLSALGADNNGEAALTYTWSATGPGAVTYSANGTNAAKNSVATFSKAGAYSFTVTIRDAGGSTVTSNVNVTVIRTLTSVGVTPATATVNTNATRQFTATAYDQFAQSMASQPTFTWSIASGAGAVNPSGLYTAPASAGSATIRATSAGVSGTASITVVATGIPSAPSGLTATAASSGQVNLTWNDTANNETGFIIDRATNASFTAGLVSVSVGANVTSRSITGLSPGVYFFHVRATNAAGDSANSNTASAKAWVIYQAEAATRGGGVTIDTNHAGYTGSGFANFPKSGGYLDWTVSTAAAGTYSLGFRYALASGTRNVQLTVNGVAISGGLTFTSSNSWSSWVTVNLTVNLAAGANTIRLMSTGQDSGNIDSLSVTPV